MNLSGLQNKKTWNALQTKQGHKATTEFYGKWIHYFDGSDWQPIDCSLTETLGGYVMTDAPFEFTAPLYSDTEATFNNNNKFDVFKKESIDAPDFGQSMKALDVTRVRGQLFDMNEDGVMNAVIYPDAFGTGLDLIYYVEHGRAPRMKKIVKINEPLLEDRQFRFRIRYTSIPEISPKYKLDTTARLTVRNTVKDMFDLGQPVYSDDGFYVRKWGESEKRGIGIKKPLIWDSGVGKERIAKLIEVFINRVGVDYILTKQIKASLTEDMTFPVFTDTTSTFYPDPHPETTSVDGALARNDVTENWATIRAGTGINAIPSGDGTGWGFVQIQSQTTSGNWKNISRGSYGFDLSSISGDTISSGTFSNYGWLAVDPFTSSIVLASHNPASNTDLVTADHEIANFGSTEYASRKTFASYNTSGYNDVVVNASGVAFCQGASVINFGTLTDHDFDDIEPTWANANGVLANYFADRAVPTEIPKLVLVHSVERAVGRGRTKTLFRKSTGMTVGFN